MLSHALGRMRFMAMLTSSFETARWMRETSSMERQSRLFDVISSERPRGGLSKRIKPSFLLITKACVKP